MKKSVAVLTAAILILAIDLSGCGKSKSVIATEELISAIGQVSLESVEDIQKARTAFDALTDKEKHTLENYEMLIKAETEYEELVSIAAAEAAITEELVEDSWINVNNGDRYSFFSDGTGKHNGIAIIFSRTEDSVSVVEGVASVRPRVFLWDRNSEIARLIPEGENECYVRERDYDTVSQQILQENISILISQSSWKASTEPAYYQFLNSGYGRLVMLDYLTFTFSWEMVDNNTVRLEIDYNGGLYSILDIINENGRYYLATEDRSVIFTPYNNK